MRHLLFVIPPLTVLASAGWVSALEATSGVTRLLVAAVLVAGVIEPLGFQWRNHPNQVAYVQPLAGGPAAAFGRYDLDYWGNCMLESMARLALQHPQRQVRVTGWPLVVLQMNAGRFPTLEVVAESAAELPELMFRPTYSVELVRGRRDHVVQLASMPDVVDRVTTVDGAVLCVTRAAAQPLPQAVFTRSK